MKQIKFLLFAVLISIFSSCNDFLIESPKSSAAVNGFYQSESDAIQAINGIYGTLSNDKVVGYTIKAIPNDLYKHAIWDNQNGLADYSFTASNEFFRDMWQGHYACIKNCNSAIDNIIKNKEKINNYSRYIAQAKGVRAYLYFDLVRWFGDVPLVLSPMTQIQAGAGQVMRTSQDLVFKQIISDLTECSTNSMQKDSIKQGYQYGLLTCEAAHGILAKVYLWMASIGQRDNSTLLGDYISNYKSALLHAQTVISSRKYKLTAYYPDLFTISTENKARDEVLFCTQAMRGDGTGSLTGMYFGITGDLLFGASYGNVISTNFHRMIYEPSDSIRRLWNCPHMKILPKTGLLSGWDYNAYLNTDPSAAALDRTKEKSSGLNYCIGKFRRYPVPDLASYTSLDGMDEPLLRYADVLLIYAEAYNEINHGPGTSSGSVGSDFIGTTTMSGFDAVNIVRKRARTFNFGLVHQNLFPRSLNLSNTDLVNTCVPDWKTGFFGYRYDGSPVYSSNGYSNDYTAFREEILWERGRELVAETNDRWCDLVRRNKLVSQIQSLRTIINPFVTANEALPSPSSPENIRPYMMLLPIPQSEIDVNRNLTQNPSY